MKHLLSIEDLTRADLVRLLDLTDHMVEIGAGGGSLAHVDALGRIGVGPESAGAMPGPACYGMGGTKPTVTDANVALGFLDQAALAGGTVAITDASRIVAKYLPARCAIALLLAWAR